MSKAAARPRSFLGRLRAPGWLVVLASLIALSALQFHALAASQAALPRLTAVSAKVDGRTTAVVIEATEPVPYEVRQPDPLTVVGELRNVDGSRVTNLQPVVAHEPVSGLTVEQGKSDDGTSVTRVRIGLTRPARHTVKSSRNLISVQFESSGGVPVTAEKPVAESAVPASPIEPVDKAPDGEPAAAAPASAPGAAKPAARLPLQRETAPQPPPTQAPPSKPATELTAIQPTLDGDAVRITLTGNGYLAPTQVLQVTTPPPRLVLDFQGVRQAVPAVVAVGQGLVKQIRVGPFSQQPQVTRVVLDLTRQTPHRVERAGDAVVVIVGEAAGPAASKTSVGERVEAGPAVVARNGAGTGRVGPKLDAAPVVPAATPSPRPDPPRADPAATDPPKPEPSRPEPRKAEPVKLEPLKPVTQKPDPPAPPPAAVTALRTQAPGVGQMIPQGRGDKQYTGFPVSFDFTGADLRQVIRTFAEDAGLNIVLDPAVQGSVDVNFRDVPWDQALDLILRSNKLGYTLEGSVVRIAPLIVLAEEEKQRQQLVDAQAMSGQLGVVTRALSYAKAEDLSELLKQSTLTTRGQVQVDKRTNTIIIRDLPAALAVAESLLTTLDKAQPQVEIEARIVQTTRSSAQALGVQWGFNAKANSELGNTLPTTFPAQGSISGRVGGAQGNVEAPARSMVPTGVNLGVSSPTTSVGIAMGSLTGAFNLELALSALVKKGQGRILSTPRVVMQNNVEAEVYQGTQIPIQTVSNNTVTVTFKDAALSLRVTPQITAADTVIMNITLENATPDYSRQVNGIPPIDTQRARTQVLVRDNETTVLGGVVVSQSQSTNDKVPIMSRIPLLGWLFKRDTSNDGNTELLIFITPRIIRQ
jgi:type IV pilus secretin PilQ/predicted competence protein